MLLLNQNIIKKEQIEKKISKSNFNTSNSKEYKVEVVQNSVVYVNWISTVL